MSVRVLEGDCRVRLLDVPEHSVHAVITSPPYYALRKYAGVPPTMWGGDATCEHEWRDATVTRNKGDASAGPKQRSNGGSLGWRDHPNPQAWCTRCSAWLGTLGNEPTVSMYVNHLVEVFRLVRRVLRQDGSLWLNLGDTYGGGGGGNTGSGQDEGYKPGDMLGIPALVSEALRQDGWYRRFCAPWIKPASMPESVTNRPNNTIEWVYLLTPGRRSYYDWAAVRVPGADPTRVRKNERFGGVNGATVRHSEGGIVNGVNETRHLRNTDFFFTSLDDLIEQQRDYLHHLLEVRNNGGMLLDEGGSALAFNVNPATYAEEHYATFAEDFIRPMILASTSQRGCCAQCGKPWQRVLIPTGVTTDREREDVGDWLPDKGGNPSGMRSLNGKTYQRRWAPTNEFRQACACKVEGESEPCTVLDPFGGAGTTALEADRHGRVGISIELSREYVDLQVRRVQADAPMFTQLSLA